jgi:hypothetical protein
MTLFDLLEWMFTMCAAVAGFVAGHRLGGRLGALVGVVAGIFVGWNVSQIPDKLWVAAVRRSMRRATSERLRDYLEAEQYRLSSFAMEELARRGEPAESFREFIATELGSSDFRIQLFGRGNAKRWLPDLLEQKRDGPI